MGAEGDYKRIEFLFSLLAVLDGFCGELSRMCCLYYWEIKALHFGGRLVSQSL